MNRLMTLRLRTRGCTAEAVLNGVPLMRVNAPGGTTAMPVHEFLLRGHNRLTLRIDPASVDLSASTSASATRAAPTSPAASTPSASSTFPAYPSSPSSRETSTSPGAELTLCLGRAGADPAAPASNERTLARTGWGDGHTEETPGPDELPTSPGDGAALWRRRVDVDLPVDFPRWRWLDVPPVAAASLDAMRVRALQCVRQRILEFRRGDAVGWLALTRLALEDRAVAYGGDVRAREFSFLETLRAAPDGQPWSWTWPDDEDFLLRPEADGRLMSCLRRTGGPALTARSRDGRHAWSLPLRLAWVDDRLHGLR